MTFLYRYFALKKIIDIIDPVDYNTNVHSICVGIELSYKKQVVAAAEVCSEGSASTASSRTVDKVGPMV